MIPFNKPFIAKNQMMYFREAMKKRHWSGDGFFTVQSQKFLEKRYNYKKVLLTTSCTDALELAALLIDIKPGDEVIVPSYTFVSSANPFLLRGARIVFVDSEDNSPNIDTNQLDKLITKKTKAIVVVHYGGVSVNMDKVLKISKKHSLFVIEDAAQGIESFYKKKPLGGIGDIGALSFHETKNITSGEGGAIIINNESLIKRAEIIREKGTNRAAFFRGEIDKYSWVDIGSSFLPSEFNAAILFAQLEEVKKITFRRKAIWELYFKKLKKGAELGYFNIPMIPAFSQHNAHLFYVVCKDLKARTALINHLKIRKISANFHYQSLSESQYAITNKMNSPLKNSKKYTDCLVRLPLFYELRDKEVIKICKVILEFYQD